LFLRFGKMLPHPRNEFGAVGKPLDAALEQFLRFTLHRMRVLEPGHVQFHRAFCHMRSCPRDAQVGSEFLSRGGARTYANDLSELLGTEHPAARR
jgi:hypothetical protein